jgi:hypothetical protein
MSAIKRKLLEYVAHFVEPNAHLASSARRRLLQPSLGLHAIEQDLVTVFSAVV